MRTRAWETVRPVSERHNLCFLLSLAQVLHSGQNRRSEIEPVNALKDGGNRVK